MVKHKKEKYIVSGSEEFKFDVRNYHIYGKKQHIEQTGSNSYLVDFEKEIFKGEVVQLKQNKCTVLLNGNTYTFLIGKEETLLLKQQSAGRSSGSQHYQLKSPMPGKIVDVFAAKGAKIEKGEPLVVLEAMKMQNLLQAEENGTITAVNIRIGENVLGDQVLVEIKKE